MEDRQGVDDDESRHEYLSNTSISSEIPGHCAVCGVQVSLAETRFYEFPTFPYDFSKKSHISIKTIDAGSKDCRFCALLLQVIDSWTRSRKQDHQVQAVSFDLWVCQGNWKFEIEIFGTGEPTVTEEDGIKLDVFCMKGKYFSCRPCPADRLARNHRHRLAMELSQAARGFWKHVVSAGRIDNEEMASSMRAEP